MEGMIPGDLTEWQAQKRQLTRDAFGRAFPHPFLLRRAHSKKDGEDGAAGSDFGEQKLGFRTNVSDAGSTQDVPTGSVRMLGALVLPIVKKPTNPYPERISVGRALNCDVVIRDGTVSKLHGHFVPVSAREADLVDRASQNGTKVNGQPLKPEIARRVVSGDTIIFGSIAVQFLDAKKLWDLL
jgi:hypothetical protein